MNLCIQERRIVHVPLHLMLLAYNASTHDTQEYTVKKAN